MPFEEMIELYPEQTCPFRVFGTLCAMKINDYLLIEMGLNASPQVYAGMQ